MTNDDTAVSFEPYYRLRRWTQRFGLLALVLIVAAAILAALTGPGSAAVWVRLDGVLMIVGGVCCLVFAALMLRNAQFRCPRCGHAFFRRFALGDALYGMATTCQHCGLKRIEPGG